MYFYVYNLQGDVTHILDASKNIVGTYEYDAWGKILNFDSLTGIAQINPFRYRGYYYDTESGLYYLNSRYYNPEWGRFLNTDDVSLLGVNGDFSSYNLFAYCGNNPIVRLDTGGDVWETVFDVASLGVSIVEVCVNPTDVWAWAGLVGDAVDLVPFVTGVGEATKAIKVAKTAIENADNVIDIAKTTKKTVSSSVGAYEIAYKSGKTYIGKGTFDRAIQSAKRYTKPNKLNNMQGDIVTSIRWRASKNSHSAFIEEYALQTQYGVGHSNTYNKIWSPGKKYYKSISTWF